MPRERTVNWQRTFAAWKPWRIELPKWLEELIEHDRKDSMPCEIAPYERTDTERMDWLEQAAPRGWELDDWRPEEPRVRFLGDGATPERETIREAIDAAMDAEESSRDE